MERIFDYNPRLGISTIFQSARVASSHERLMKNLYSIFSNSSQSKFILEFLQCLAVSMTYLEKQTPVENTLDFAAKYCIYHESLVGEEDNVLLLAVFEFIFDNTNRLLPAIRFRTCEFVNRLLQKMGPQASLDDDIFDKMSASMLERLQDKMPSIRAQAVMALQRLQDPTNKNCRIIKAFSYHMEADPSVDVRTRVIQNIAVTQRTVPLIIGRLQDIKETVRKEAYKILSRLKPQKFSIIQRQIILSRGIADKSDSVKTFVKESVIPSWFRICNCNFIDFLSILDVVTIKSEIVYDVLNHVFSYTEIPRSELIAVVERLEAESCGKRVIPIKELSPEAATLWACVIRYLGFDCCESILLPELTNFAKYISTYCSNAKLYNSVDDQYILKQLLEIAKCYSLMDEMGRKEMVQTCIDILKNDNIGVKVIPSIVTFFDLLVPNVKDRMVLMAELISDIREPLESDDQEMNEIDWEARGVPKENDYVEIIAEGMSQLQCQSQSLECSRTERTDPETLVRCLTIIKEMLKSPSVNCIDSTLLSLKNLFIINCFKSEDGRVLGLATDTLTLFCIWSLPIAKEFFLKFCIHIADDSTSISAIEAIFDILLVHGFEPFSNGILMEDNTNSEMGEILGEGTALDFTCDLSMSPFARRIVSLLASLLKSNMKEVKYKVSEGLSKLLLSSRIDSPIVLAHLIIMWFSPSTDAEPLIRQPLGLFFSMFSSRRIGAPEIILQAFSPTLRGIEELQDELMDSTKVANLFVTLLSPHISSKIGKPKTGSGSYHAQLALIIFQEIRHEKIPLNVLTKALSSIRLQDSDFEVKEKLSAFAHRAYKFVLKRCGERRLINVVKKCRDDIDKFIEKHPEKISTCGKGLSSENEDLNMNEPITEGKRSMNNANEETMHGTNESKVDQRIPSQDDCSNTSNISGSYSSSSKLPEGTEGSKSHERNSVDETVVPDSDEDVSRKRKSSTEADSVVEENSSSPEIIAPSPPKLRSLRTRNK